MEEDLKEHEVNELKRRQIGEEAKGHKVCRASEVSKYCSKLGGNYCLYSNSLISMKTPSPKPNKQQADKVNDCITNTSLYNKMTVKIILSSLVL